MEDEDYYLNQNICQECGLYLIIDSYETKSDSEKLFIKLTCQNLEHTKKYEFIFDDYYNNLIKEKLHNICKCTICKNIIKNNKIPYYCYDCKKIICSGCIINMHTKDHNIYQFNDLKNKCLIHYNNNKNDFLYYCFLCKRNMCKYCYKEDLNHERSIQSIDNLRIINQNNIKMIQEEKENLLKKIKNLEYQIFFKDLLIKENSNNFNLFNIYNIERNSIPNINISSDKVKIEKVEKNNKEDNSLKKEINNKENKYINIIYHNQNLKDNEGHFVIKECERIQNLINGNVILTNDISKLNLVLQYLLKIRTKSKFVLIVNGWCAEDVYNFINNNNYSSLFINACIFTSKIAKHQETKNQYSHFYKNICDTKKGLKEYIKSCFQNNNEKFIFNSLINIDSYDKNYFLLHKELSLFYGDESENSFFSNFSNIKKYINENFEKKIKDSLINCFMIFLELNKKNYEKIISVYLENYYFSKYLNLLLNQKDLSLFKMFGYFTGNLMYCLVQYGKKWKKGVIIKKTFYWGTELNIIELLEYFKNRNKKITFPFFLSITTKKELAEICAKRNINYKKRKEKYLFSVIMKIDYLLNDEYEPSVFELKDLSQFKDEEEYILLPFTFLKLNKFIIDSDKFTADLELEIIGKKVIFENIIKESGKMIYDSDLNIMIVK